MTKKPRRPAELPSPHQFERLQQACREWLDALAIEPDTYEESAAFDEISRAALLCVYGPAIKPYLASKEECTFEPED